MSNDGGIGIGAIGDGQSLPENWWGCPICGKPCQMPKKGKHSGFCGEEWCDHPEDAHLTGRLLIENRRSES